MLTHYTRCIRLKTKFYITLYTTEEFEIEEIKMDFQLLKILFAIKMSHFPLYM